MRSIEREARVSRRTIERVLAGEVLPDFGALARLEQWLEADLWPGSEMRPEQDPE
jgi:transcriptional regulator with XRE-family HTH domain